MRSRAVAALTIFAGALVTGGWLLQRGLAHAGDGASATMLHEVVQHVETDYVDSIPAGTVYAKAVTGMLHELHDPYSVFLPPKKLRSLDETTSGNYAGLGIQIDLRDGWITIIAPVPGSPAARAGIEAGDRLLAVDGHSAAGWTIDAASRALRGRAGTRVALTVERPGVEAHIPFSIVRADIHVHSVAHALMLGPHIGYIDLTVFSDSSASELRDAIAHLQRRGMQTLIFDLRSNPGGLLDQGVAVADLFLNRGQEVVAMRGRSPGTTRTFSAQQSQPWPALSLIALVNGYSASAAEIVAGALQDHDRALVMGTTSYGKGSAQSIFPVAGGNAVKLTVARWYTPSGRSIQRPHPMSAADSAAADFASADSADSITTRPVYHTDDGRVVYGGGGITPDVPVASEDSVTGALALWRSLGPRIPRLRDALTAEAIAVKTSHAVASPAFVVTPAMRAALGRRLAAADVKLDRAQLDSAGPALDRMLGDEIARFTFGPAAAFRRALAGDRVVLAAEQLAAGSPSERVLLSRGAARASQDSASRRGSAATPPAAR